MSIIYTLKCFLSKANIMPDLIDLRRLGFLKAYANYISCGLSRTFDFKPSVLAGLLQITRGVLSELFAIL